MLTKRKLLAWRTEALKVLAQNHSEQSLISKPFSLIHPTRLANERILTLTQELIDQHLLVETSK